jgi:hypothetical protein
VDHDSVGANSRVTPNLNCPDNFCAGPNEDMVTEHGGLLSFCSDRYLMLEVHMIAAADFSIDDNAGGMNQYEGDAKLRTAADDAIATNCV